MTSNGFDGNTDSSSQTDRFLQALRSAASKAQMAANRFRGNTLNLESTSINRLARPEVFSKEYSPVYLKKLEQELALQTAKKDPEILQYDQIIENHHKLQSHHATTGRVETAISETNGKKDSNRQVECNGDQDLLSFKSAISTPIELGSSSDLSYLTPTELSTHNSDVSDHLPDSSVVVVVDSSRQTRRSLSSQMPIPACSHAQKSDRSNDPFESQEVDGNLQANIHSSSSLSVIGKRKRDEISSPRGKGQPLYTFRENPFRKVMFQLDTVKRGRTDPVQVAVLQKKRVNIDKYAWPECQPAAVVDPQSQHVLQRQLNQIPSQKIGYDHGKVRTNQTDVLHASLEEVRPVQNIVKSDPSDLSLLGPGQTISSGQSALANDFLSESRMQLSTLPSKEIALQRDPNSTGFTWSNINTCSRSQNPTPQDFLHKDRQQSYDSSTSLRSSTGPAERVPSEILVPLSTNIKSASVTRNLNSSECSYIRLGLGSGDCLPSESVVTDHNRKSVPKILNIPSSDRQSRTGPQLKNQNEVNSSYHSLSPYSPKSRNKTRANKLSNPMHPALPLPNIHLPTIPTQTRRNAQLAGASLSSPSPQKITHYVPSIRAAPTSSLLRSRELGRAYFDGTFLTSQGIQIALRKEFSDGITYWRDWTGASKDVLAVAWAPDGMNFAIGTSTDLDNLNIQYNRRNNLLLGSLESNTLRELPDHYVDRPLPETIESGDNSLQATFDTVDPELYTTVSSISFNHRSDRMFTGSYDCTVKVWDVARGKSTCVSTLHHEEVVDHLALSGKHIATGQKAIQKSVRIYQLDSFDDLHNINVDHTPIATFESTRAQRLRMYPTCLQFGKTPVTTGLLLGGYGALNVDNKASDREGDICLWHVETGNSFKITPMAQSVWDIAWHPNSSIFAAATAPGPRAKLTSRTTTHSLVRTWSPLESLGRIMEYECPAADINLVTFNPRDDNYVSASCTDGSTYVWDCRAPDQILHQLQHGKPIDELDSELSIEDQDTGVCMSVWDQDGRVLYTGSSDGVIKAWNIYQSTEDASIREVAKFDSGIMCGSFSPDYTNLLVGLSKGSIQILSSSPTTHPSSQDEVATNLNAPYEKMRHIPAKEPEKEGSGIAAAQELLSSGKLTMHPVYGAGQGPNYDGPYAAYAHPHDAEPSVSDLLPEFRAMQLDEGERRAGRRAGGKPDASKAYRNACKIAYVRNYSRYGIKQEKQGEKRKLERDERSGGVKRGRGTAHDPISLDDDDDDVEVVGWTEKGRGEKKEEEEVEAEDDDYEEDPLEEDYWVY